MGSSAVFFKKPLAEENILNDKNKDIVKIHRELQKGWKVKNCDLRPSKDKFDKIKNKKNKTACDVLYLNKHSFGCMFKTFSISKNKRKAKDTGIIYQIAHNDEYKEKLKDVKILNQDFKEVVKKYDDKDSFTYMDPPYIIGGDSYAINGVTPKEVCDTAKQIKGKVMISYDNRPEVKKACEGLNVKKVNVRYTLPRYTNNMKVKELLITNF